MASTRPEFTAARIESEYAVEDTGLKGQSTFWYAGGVGLVRLSFGGTWALKSFTAGKD